MRMQPMDECDLWAAIQAAGPLDELASFDPLNVEDVVWAERQTTQFDRRKSFVANYSWAVPTRQAIQKLCDRVGRRSVLEVGAGNGLWAYLLAKHGVSIVATDAAEPPQAPWFPIEACEAVTAVERHPECAALLLCWPPFKEPCAFQALRAFSGELLIYIGDARFTADGQFHALLKESWSQVEEILLPSWPGTSDAARIYTRG